jgi:NADPH-dependent 7-cyano-7-deazaguanine reductase QueF-like protein
MAQASLTKTQVNVQLPSRNLLQNSSLKLRLLNDVNAASLQNGDVVQYNSTTDQFTTAPVNITRVNGGTF